MSSPQLILASASPRRQSLLREAGYVFSICPANVNEEDYPRPILAVDLATLLSEKKARAVAVDHPRDVVLGSDTVIALDLFEKGEELLGKPEGPAHAAKMLRQLSGTTHRVVTGVCLVCLFEQKINLQVETSTVRMRELSDSEIQTYVKSRQWEGKAGGYGIQDQDPFVTNLKGSLSNIVGLPMELTGKMLQEFGILPSLKT